MTDKVERQIAVGKRAQEWLDDDLIRSVFADIEEQQFRAWRNSPARDTEGREKIWQFLAMMGLIRNHLQAIADDGKTASVMMEQENGARRFERLHGYRPDLGEIRPEEYETDAPGVVPGAPM